MQRTLREQLLDAFQAQDLTFRELLRRSKLECSEESLARKLRGEQSLRSQEVEAIAGALNVVVAFDGAAEAATTAAGGAS